MAATTRRARRPVAATLTLLVVTGVGIVSVLPAYGFASSSSAATAMAVAGSTPTGQQDGVAPVASGAVEAVGDLRDGFSSLSVQQQKEERATSYRAAMASVSRFIGDDYPFKDLGTGSSPLNYALLNCTDFVAWRLNRDAGSAGAPWLLTWGYLTPAGGDAYEWKANWDAHGWITSSVPVPGSVAWFPGMDHVAYVSKVNADGTVFIEEYNNDVHLAYDTRTIAASSATYLYPPPLPGTGNQ